MIDKSDSRTPPDEPIEEVPDTGEQLADDELSIEELEEAAGGLSEPPPPGINAAC